MKKADVTSPLFDVYSWVGNSCLALWPLFFVKFLFLILQYATLFICLGLLFGPFITRNGPRIAEGLEHPKDFDWTPMLSDWVATLTDPGWIGICIAVVLLYITWWCLLSGLEDGGVFGTFQGYFRDGTRFTWRAFFENAFRFVFPMVWLQFYLSLWFLGAAFAWALVALVAVGLLALTGFNLAVGIATAVVLGVPFVIFWILFCLGFVVFAYLCKAFLIQGESPVKAMVKAYSKFKADGWRVGIGLSVAFITYIAVCLGLKMVFGLLSLVPLVGLLFSLLDMLTGCALAIFIMVYLSGLSVAYLQDEAGA